MSISKPRRRHRRVVAAALPHASSVQKTSYEAKANGPSMETGCFEPPYGH